MLQCIKIDTFVNLDFDQTTFIEPVPVLVRSLGWCYLWVWFLSISDAGRAEPDRRRRWTLVYCKLPWALVAQLTVWSPLIVFLAIVFYDHSD